jgi:hypothetical protein
MNTSRLVLGLAALFSTIASALAIDSQKTIGATYKLRPGDKVSIAVFQEEKLRLKNVVVDPTGDLPVAGRSLPVHVAHLSVRDAETAIARAYTADGLIVNPRVSLVIESYAPPIQTPETVRTHLRNVVKIPLRDHTPTFPEDPIRADAKVAKKKPQEASRPTP